MKATQISKPDKNGRSKWEVQHLIIYTSSEKEAIKQFNIINKHCPANSPNPPTN